jgi:hypothetical protein
VCAVIGPSVEAEVADGDEIAVIRRFGEPVMVAEAHWKVGQFGPADVPVLIQRTFNEADVKISRWSFHA